MNDVKWSLKESDIVWEMDWKGRDFTGHPHPPKVDERGIETVFEEEAALAHLLMNGVICLNSFWWEKHAPKRLRQAVSMAVNCNDVFAWGCADAEPLPYREIENLYRMWKKDPEWGAEVWCIVQRNCWPQRPVLERIKAKGIWDLEELLKERAAKTRKKTEGPYG